MTNQIVSEFLAAVKNADIHADLFTSDVVLDATVPNWRFQAHGADAVVEELAEWYADEGTFESVQRYALEGGELVEFTLAWQEDGVGHLCHQLHLLEIRDGAIARDVAFCGGRWPQPLQEEMAASQRANDAADS